MALHAIAAFWAVALLLIAVPGPDWAFIIGTVLGGRSLARAVAGLAIGYSAMTLVVAVGVGAIVARSSWALTALTIAGGLYLIWLGFQTFIRHHAVRAETDEGHRGTLVRGIGVSGLNPKGLLVFLALLPQFTSPGGSWPLVAQLAVLGAVFVVTNAAFYLCLGTFARGILRTRQAAARLVTRISGAAMIIIGAFLLVERLLT
jgi:threonine/homoserine/homoserine lactone efflux protein